MARIAGMKISGMPWWSHQNPLGKTDKMEKQTSGVLQPETIHKIYINIIKFHKPWGVLSTSKPFQHLWIPKGLLQPEPETSGMFLSSDVVPGSWLWHLLSGDGIQYGWKSRGSDIFVEKVWTFEVFTTTVFHLTSRNVVSFAATTESCCVSFQHLHTSPVLTCLHVDLSILGLARRGGYMFCMDIHFFADHVQRYSYIQTTCNHGHDMYQSFSTFWRTIVTDMSQPLHLAWDSISRTARKQDEAYFYFKKFGWQLL